MPDLIELLPASWSRYYEPFVGGGALFFSLVPRNAFLSDRNADLINCYLVVRDEIEELLDQLRRLKNNAQTYYQLRTRRLTDRVERAARLIYLTSLSFNGIYRVNSKGVFNVPYGNRKAKAPFDESALRAASAALSEAVIAVADFSEAVTSASRGDLIYMDPPYTVAHSNNGFVRYNERLFSWQDQVRLATYAKELTHRGCSVIISSAFHPSVRQLYPNFTVHLVKRQGSVAAARNHRGLVREYVFRSKS